jgi:hypothetical protein
VESEVGSPDRDLWDTLVLTSPVPDAGFHTEQTKPPEPCDSGGFVQVEPAGVERAAITPRLGRAR